MINHFPVIIQTEESFLIAGYLPEKTDLTCRSIMNVQRTKTIIRQRTGKGVEGFATDGPSKSCKLSSECPQMLAIHRVVNVYAVTEKAEQAIWSDED